MENIRYILEYKGEPTKFALVGISGIFVNFFMIFLVTNLSDLSDEIAFATGIFISMSTNYFFNRIWTFDSVKPLIPEYLRFIVYNSIGGLIQLFISVSINSSIAKNSFTVLFIPITTVYFASSIGIGFAFIFNFITSKFLVFTKGTLNEGSDYQDEV